MLEFTYKFCKNRFSRSQNLVQTVGFMSCSTTVPPFVHFFDNNKAFEKHCYEARKWYLK